MNDDEFVTALKALRNGQPLGPAVDAEFWDLLLRMNEDAIVELLGSDETAPLSKHLHDALGHDDETRSTIGGYTYKVLTQESGYQFSWLLGHNDTGARYLPELLSALASDDGAMWVETAARETMSDNPLIPVDLRSDLTDWLLVWIPKVGWDDTCTELAGAALSRSMPFEVRSLREKIRAGSNGIDHCFPNPPSFSALADLLDEAARRKTNEIVLDDVRRLLEVAPDEVRDAWTATIVTRARPRYDARDQNVPVGICDSVEGAPGQKRPWDAFVIHWDQLIAGADDSYRYTIAELARLVLLTGNFALPDETFQEVRLAFYRGVFRIASGCTMGLTAGPFHVEHGNRTQTSVFYMAQGVTLGKSLMIDCTGHVVLHASSFLGGGFMPILVHTHKHVASESEGVVGTLERRAVKRVGLIAHEGSRLPMDVAKVYEVTDWIGSESPIAGLQAVGLELEK